MRGSVKAVKRDLDRFDVIAGTKTHKFMVTISKDSFGKKVCEKEVEDWVSLINKAILRQANFHNY